jgi:hypothetical protein
MDAVNLAWRFPFRNASPFQCLDWLFRNTARVLQSWSDRFIGNVRLQLEIAKGLQLEIAKSWSTS